MWVTRGGIHLHCSFGVSSGDNGMIISRFLFLKETYDDSFRQRLKEELQRCSDWVTWCFPSIRACKHSSVITLIKYYEPEYEQDTSPEYFLFPNKDKMAATNYIKNQKSGKLSPGRCCGVWHLKGWGTLRLKFTALLVNRWHLLHIKVQVGSKVIKIRAKWWDGDGAELGSPAFCVCF